MELTNYQNAVVDNEMVRLITHYSRSNTSSVFVLFYQHVLCHSSGSNTPLML